ncbi:chromatin target of PRMT1 protein-like [Pempheris klunzingeri]|uniref:chromatin target of PRMT1 protein-like n=1 Tax=Pempheris klunzingeri TaxID=3127111 RepID=UPI00397ED877
MSDRSVKPMNPCQPGSWFLRSTSSVSLHERFSQVLMDQVTRPRAVTFDPVQVQRRSWRAPPPAVLLAERERSPPPSLQTLRPSGRLRQCLMETRRRSVWTRLGWQRVTRGLVASGPLGFWSFRNKYRWSARFTSTYRRRANLCSRLGRRRLLTGRKIQKLTAGQTQLRPYLPGGGASAGRGRGRTTKDVPTKKQLDAQLDEYMSRSKRRLDQELDEYMSMAGQTHWD